jgi:hypothetical protein
MKSREQTTSIKNLHQKAREKLNPCGTALIRTDYVFKRRYAANCVAMLFVASHLKKFEK